MTWVQHFKFPRLPPAAPYVVPCRVNGSRRHWLWLVRLIWQGCAAFSFGRIGLEIVHRLVSVVPPGRHIDVPAQGTFALNPGSTWCIHPEALVE